MSLVFYVACCLGEGFSSSSGRRRIARSFQASPLLGYSPPVPQQLGKLGLSGMLPQCVSRSTWLLGCTRRVYPIVQFYGSMFLPGYSLITCVALVWCPTNCTAQATSARLTAQEGSTVRIQPSTHKTRVVSDSGSHAGSEIELFPYVHGLHRSNYEVLVFSRKLKDAERSTRRHFSYNARCLAYLRED